MSHTIYVTAADRTAYYNESTVNIMRSEDIYFIYIYLIIYLVFIEKNGFCGRNPLVEHSLTNELPIESKHA